MQILEAEFQNWFLTEAERAYLGLASDGPPEAGELFFESAVALALPLLLALACDLWLPAIGIPVP